MFEDATQLAKNQQTAAPAGSASGGGGGGGLRLVVECAFKGMQLATPQRMQRRTPQRRLRDARCSRLRFRGLHHQANQTQGAARGSVSAK